MVLADHGLVACEHDAVKRRGGEEGAAGTAKEEARLGSPGVATIAVERSGGVMEEGDCEGGVGVGGNVAVAFFGF